MRSADEIRRDLATEEGRGATERRSPIGRLVADVEPLLARIEAASEIARYWACDHDGFDAVLAALDSRLSVAPEGTQR